MKTNIMDRLLEIIPSNTGMELPPKVFKDMDGEFIEFIEEKSLTARFPNKERFMNPFGFMQGGIIVAAIDNTVSPLSYVLAPPNVHEGSASPQEMKDTVREAAGRGRSNF